MEKVKRCCFCAISIDIHLIETIGTIKGIGERKFRYVCGFCAQFEPHTKKGVEDLKFYIQLNLLKMIADFVEHRTSKVR